MKTPFRYEKTMIKQVQANNVTPMKQGAVKRFPDKSHEKPVANKDSVVAFSGASAIRALCFASMESTQPKPFADIAMNKNNPLWDVATAREVQSKAINPTKSEFKVDYDRIRETKAFSRLKKKTQMLIHPRSDHICTRMEHVLQVASISEDICNALGLNAELARAIALGHDIGHPPFGHEGEKALQQIAKNNKLEESFWHGKNGLKFVDKIERRTNSQGDIAPLSLTYAVRDGIIGHSGGFDNKGLKPRTDAIDLSTIKSPGRTAPFTWEACVVKIADDIAYMGRDFQDALKNNIISEKDIEQLKNKASGIIGKKVPALNTAYLEKEFVADLCANSSPEEGLKFSNSHYKLMKELRAFNIKNVYNSPIKTEDQNEQVHRIVKSIFNKLDRLYEDKPANTLSSIRKTTKNHYPQLGNAYIKWLTKHSNISPNKRKKEGYTGEVLYNIEDKKQYQQSIVDFISGMSDSFAYDSYQEITRP